MTLICTLSPQSNMFLSSPRAFSKVQWGLVGLSLILCHSATVASTLILNKNSKLSLLSLKLIYRRTLDLKTWGDCIERELWRGKSGFSNWSAVWSPDVLMLRDCSNIAINILERFFNSSVSINVHYFYVQLLGVTLQKVDGNCRIGFWANVLNQRWR